MKHTKPILTTDGNRDFFNLGKAVDILYTECRRSKALITRDIMKGRLSVAYDNNGVRYVYLYATDMHETIHLGAIDTIMFEVVKGEDVYTKIDWSDD